MLFSSTSVLLCRGRHSCDCVVVIAQWKFSGRPVVPPDEGGIQILGKNTEDKKEILKPESGKEHAQHAQQAQPSWDARSKTMPCKCLRNNP